MRAENLFSIILTSLISAGCLTSPGMDEPFILICTIKNNEVAECTHSDLGDKFEVPTIDLLGYMCVRPTGFASLKSHHEVLHRELNMCKAKK